MNQLNKYNSDITKDSPCLSFFTWLTQIYITLLPIFGIIYFNVYSPQERSQTTSFVIESLIKCIFPFYFAYEFLAFFSPLYKIITNKKNTRTFNFLT